MARGKVNKAAKIREEIEKNPEARPKDIIAALAAKKIKVSSAQVSNIKNGGKPKTKKGRKAKASNGHIALDDLLAAKKLVEALGSAERARNALDALVKIS